MKITRFAKFWFLLVFSLPIFLIAKTPKPAIIIYGSTMEAYVAALQSAASGVSTLWINPASYSFEQDCFRLADNTNSLLDGGVIQQFSKPKDLKQDSAQYYFTGGRKQAYNILTKDNLLLTILEKEDVVKIEYKKSWKVTLSNRKSYDVRVILDASKAKVLQERAKIQQTWSAVPFSKLKDLGISELRTTALLGEEAGIAYAAKLQDLFTQNDGFFVLASDRFTDTKFRLAYGQTMGAIAGYCAFFKTTPEKIDLRTLQNELLTFRARLLPWVDVSATDKHFNTLQHMFLAGILPVRYKDDNVVLDKDDSVRVEDIKAIINQYYSRAQLWFVDNNPAYLTVQNALDLIKYTAFRGEELDVEVKKKWSKELTFKGDYDPSKVISRYEFAVLFDLYASPFGKKVSLDGTTIYR